jgi:hypothetical protein
MSFTQETFASVGAQATDTPTVYSYKTDDSISTVTGTGYFADKQLVFEPGDLILTQAAEGFFVVQIQSDTSSGSVSGGLRETVVVESEDDFPPSVGGRHPLEAKVYQIDGPVVIEDGLDMANGTTIWSTGVVPNFLTYTGNDEMIRARDANWFCVQVGLNCPNGSLFDYEDVDTPNTTIGGLLNVLVGACDSIGRVDNVFSLRLFQTQINNIVSNGLTCEGFINQIATDLFSGVLNAGVLYDLGTATFNVIDISIFDWVLAAGTTYISGEPDSDNLTAGGQAQVLNGRLFGPGTDLNGVTVNDVRWVFEKVNRIPDTNPDALISLNNNAVATVISTVNTPVKLNGNNAFVEEEASFFETDATGRITYKGEKPLTAPVDVSVTLDAAGFGADTVTAYVAKDGAPIANSGRSAQGGFGGIVNINIPWQITFDTDEFIEVFVENNSDTSNITATSCAIRVR